MSKVTVQLIRPWRDRLGLKSLDGLSSDCKKVARAADSEILELWNELDKCVKQLNLSAESDKTMQIELLETKLALKNSLEWSQKTVKAKNQMIGKLKTRVANLKMVNVAQSKAITRLKKGLPV